MFLTFSRRALAEAWPLGLPTTTSTAATTVHTPTLILPFTSRVLSISDMVRKFRIQIDMSVYSYVLLLYLYLKSYTL